ncbi:MAG: F0F1 ATP synthase subunit delta, partial [Coriobacteriia bacterium]|nr:F0F1 ATP synthase subunit delta [Coriobacteriia bacterium]
GAAKSLGDVYRSFGEIAEAERGIVIAEVTTAIALTDATRASLVDKLSAALGSPVSLRERVDGSILGGVRINVAGRVLDGSIASQLDAMRAALSNASQGGEA